MSLKYRLITRSDFDGLVCAILLKEIDLIDDILFVHPKDMQDGKIEVTAGDITTNLPYVAEAFMVFDHHLSETVRNTGERGNHVIDPLAPSAARVVYNHFGGRLAFPRISEDLMAAVDQADAARYGLEDILRPRNWALLNFVMDARTGLGRFRDFRISNYQLMMHLIDFCRHHEVEEVLNLPDVIERLELYRAHQGPAAEQIQRCVRVVGKVAILDLRNEEVIYATNRFLVYALFPRCNLSIHVMWGLRRQNTVLAIGKSILDRSSRTDVGEICLRHGGGGHRAAGTCQVPNAMAEDAINEVLAQIEVAERQALVG